MTTDNCIDICPYVGEDGMCNGECKTIKPIETLSDEQIQRGKGSSLNIIDKDKLK